MKKPKVQIIIPVYNAEKYLRRCLDSIKEQTFQSWQAICVNDASSDKSEDIISEYVKSDARFKLLRHEKNMGAAAARNTALEMLDADFTAFLDSDDYWEKDMLKIMTECAEKYDCDVVQCGFIYDFSGGQRLSPPGAFKKDTYLSEKSLKKIYIKMLTGINMNHVCMKLIKTSVIKDIRFDTGIKTAEDLKFSAEMFKNVKSCYFTDRILYHYARNPNSLTGGALSFRDRFEANRAVSKYLSGALPSWEMDTPFYRFLARIRPYIIAVSKLFRMLREIFAAKRG